MALPLLVLDNIARADTFAATKLLPEAAVSTPAPAPPPPPPPAVAVIAPAPAEADATPTTVPPTTVPPTSTTAATTTEPGPEPEPEPEPEAPANSQTGGATWYQYRAGECAHRTIAKGTTVTVTNVGNGATTTCVVTDRGPFGAGRVIDLDDGTFAEIASTSQGIVQVAISW